MSSAAAGTQAKTRNVDAPHPSRPVRPISSTNAGTKSRIQVPAPASSAHSLDAGPETIVVTGLSRTQKLQSAPTSATVFTSRAITDARIQDVSDFIALAPNVSIVEAQQAGVSFMTIRGVTQVRNGQSPVAVIVDGVQQMDSRQFTQDLYDVAQVEVLRGPQGDLWGRNAIGGAIVINSRQPTNQQYAYADAQFGNGSMYRGKVGVAGAIVKDRLFYDLDFSEHYFGGLLENVYLHKTADRTNQYSGRGHIKAVITDDLVADFRVGFNETRGGANYYQYQPAKLDPNNPCFLDLSNPFGGMTPDANHVSRTFCSNNRGLNTRDIRNASFRLAYTKPWGAITNTLGWVKINEYIASDQFPYTAYEGKSGYDGTQSQWSQSTSWEDELRFTSRSDRRFRWVAGGYFLDTRDYFSSATASDYGKGIARISVNPLYNYAANPTQSFLGNSDHNQDFALFGHLSYDILKNLTAEFGYRYDWNAMNQYVSPLSTAGIPAGCTITAGAACQRTRWFKQAQPKGTLSYRVNPNLMFFVDYGIGFRSGQFNQSGSAQAAQLPGVFDTVKPEVAHTIEAGFKSQWFHNRLTVNGSFFRTWDRNSDYFLFVGAVSAQILVNIDKIQLTGGELEARYTILPGLDVFANGGYTHSTITKYGFDRADVGNAAPYVPEFTANAGVQYTRAIAKGLNLFSRFDVEAHGKQYWDPENDTARKEFNLYNLQVGFTGPQRKWSAVFFVKNLTDKAYNAEYVSGGFVQPAEPRTLGGELSYSY
ncbi:TonB-dependent receptor [Gluconacetobacter sp. Hr-1-5]|uniref:TonB-dependent receptor n=1 Tax=Gluconacetobacter sp. Hr-1-5 TaxID=3395370 RepID=UPI003B51E5E8